MASCNGLLCLTNEYDRLKTVFYNPTTRKFRVIPGFEINGYGSLCGVVIYGFGYDDDYKLVRNFHAYSDEDDSFVGEVRVLQFKG